MNMGMFPVVIVLMRMAFSADMKVAMTMFSVLNKVPDTDHHINEAKGNEQPCCYIAAERFHINKPG